MSNKLRCTIKMDLTLLNMSHIDIHLYNEARVYILLLQIQTSLME